IQRQSLHRVELHCHLEGALRPATVLQVARRRGLKAPADTPEAFAEFLRRKSPSSLAEFLAYFPQLVEFAAGDREAIGQLAQDFVADCASNCVCYVESRFCPSLFANSELSAEGVLRAVLEGFEVGSARHGVKVRAILCALRNDPDGSSETLTLAKAYSTHGVVGVDLAGDDRADELAGGTSPKLIELFRQASAAGLHRTVHAGENSGSALVSEALDKMNAERIGHGYHCLDDPAVYQQILQRRVHLEVCPLSSRLTGAVLSDWPHHPVHRFASDRASYSINSDDPTFTGQWLAEEYRLCAEQVGLPPWELVKANYNAAWASFLPDEERQLLLGQLNDYY
uniref:Adenosine deaminase n=1 Tax=Macrostomum lignano TaxID=282301 RepID=A0A1I8FX80_9PLAT